MTPGLRSWCSTRSANSPISTLRPTVACVGGTWGDHGGHNLLEPAYHGVPVVFGPDMRHVEDEGRALLASGGGFLAGDADAIFERCRGLLADRGVRAAAGSSALGCCR